jgi:hypothetical protein
MIELALVLAAKVAYYLAAISFHYLLFFTESGNFFHGGTALGLTGLVALAMLIVLAAIRLLPKIGIKEKFLVAAGAVVPLLVFILFVIGGLPK